MTPFFASQYTIGESILTAEEEDEIKPDSPVSIFAIAKTHGLKRVCVVDEDVAGFWQMYSVAKKMDIQLIYGLKISIVDDLRAHTPESHLTESKVIIWLKNSQAYTDLVKPYSLASTEGMHGGRRLDWPALRQYWTPNFALSLPFYSSYLARNLTRLNHRSMPKFGDIPVNYIVESHDHPYDELITGAIRNVGGEIIKAHTVYYYSKAHAKSHLAIKCLHNRSTFDKPNIENFYTAETFSFEHFAKQNGTK